MYNHETMGVERAKLEGHVIRGISETHEETVLGAFVRSSLALSPGALSHLLLAADFDAFARAVRTHMLQDGLRLLPVRDPVRQCVDRLQTSVYCDPLARQVLIVYAPTPGERLEFVQFCAL
jgi:hypothetical protein